jgi:predicted DNA-binding transcriptional regulator AlpA
MDAVDHFLAESGLISDERSSELTGIPLSEFLRLERDFDFPGGVYILPRLSARAEAEVLCWALNHPERCSKTHREILRLLRAHGTLSSNQLAGRARGLSLREIRQAIDFLGFPGARCVGGRWLWLGAEIDVWFWQWPNGVGEIRAALALSAPEQDTVTHREDREVVL